MKLVYLNIIKKYRSPNHYPASFFREINKVVIHATAIDSWENTKKWFMSAHSEESAHYVIDKNGEIYEMVDEIFPAWHAGEMNLNSIGIQLVNNSIKKYPEIQVEEAAKLTADILNRHEMSIDNLVRHSDVSGERGKRDPYNHFPWEEFKLKVRGFLEISDLPKITITYES